MSDAAVFDANVLPVSRGLSSIVWLSIRKLCVVRSLRMVIPDLVVHESVNLRRERYKEASSRLLEAIRDISRFYDAESIYVPDVDQICQEWEDELRGEFEVVGLHSDDAAEALVREARRRRPARGGKGSRDSAIWMTVLRLADEYSRVFFVSRNTKDFASEDGTALHASLQDEAATTSGTILYFPGVDPFISAIADNAEPPELQAQQVVDSLRFDIRDSVLKVLTDADSKITTGELDGETVIVFDVKTLRSYRIDDDVLTLVELSASIMIGDPRDGYPTRITVIAWIQYSLTSSTIAGGEVVEVRGLPV
jgi:hypothetical protein